MTVIKALIVIIQDRINHLEILEGSYEVGEDKLNLLREVNGLENILNILVGLDE